MSVIVSCEEFGKNSMEKAEMLLAAIPGGVSKAVKSAIVRTAQHVKTQSSKRARERYAISAGTLKSRSDVQISYNYTAGEGVQANINFRGQKIALHKFSGASPSSPAYGGDPVPVKIGGDWKLARPGVTARGHQLVSTSPTTFGKAFVAQFGSGHVGIFERTGGVTSSGADALKELMGDSFPQMIDNMEVADKLAKDAISKFDERIEHEIDTILNGWR